MMNPKIMQLKNNEESFRQGLIKRRGIAESYLFRLATHEEIKKNNQEVGK